MNTEELLVSKGIEYRPQGGDFVIKCLNPSHDDSNPSMRVDQASGMFHCFSCGFSGNLFRHFGLIQSSGSLLQLKAERLRAVIRDLSANGVSFPLGAMPYDSDYRGISGDTFARFHAFTSDIPELEGRLVVPLHDISGKLIGFNGRYLYSNATPKYVFYPAHIQPQPFPAKVAPINGSIILVEGIFDMLNLHDKGLTNAVCVFGVSFGASKSRAKAEAALSKLDNYKLQGAHKAYIMFDGDQPGRNAAIDLKTKLSNKFDTEIIELDDGVDPGVLSSEDVAQLKELLYG